MKPTKAIPKLKHKTEFQNLKSDSFFFGEYKLFLIHKLSKVFSFMTKDAFTLRCPSYCTV